MQRKGVVTVKRFVCLCSPKTMEEIQHVFENCFVADPYAAIQKRQIPWLGNIARAAIEKCPLLIISPSESFDDPIFLLIDQSFNIRDEKELKRPCFFELDLNSSSFLFSAFSSTEYLEWIDALNIAGRECLQVSHNSQYANSTAEWVQALPAMPQSAPEEAIVLQ